MQHLFLTCIFSLVSLSALAQTVPPDRDFFLKAAEGGLAEVEAGKLAQKRAFSPQVGDFGAMMVRDHTKANDKLKILAAKKQIPLPTELNAEHQAMKRELETKQGSDFDAAYIKGQIEDHEATEALLRSEIKSGKDADARAFAEETLPTVTAHLAKAKNLLAPAQPAGRQKVPESSTE